MADEQRLLKEDGYLNIATDSSSITYHPSLNVILVFNRKNEVKVLDVNSGVILQSCILSDANGEIKGRYMSAQEKILLSDGKSLGLRGDYNGVLLLDTILQKPVSQNDDIVRVELLLSEAILFQKSLQNLEEHGIECPSDVSNELLEKIKESQANAKKGIKAQRWNTICLELPYSSLKLVANNVVCNLKRLDRHIPALAIASAINERLTDLLIGSRVIDTCNSGNFQRFLMYSEAARRQTFEKWPHMDYKWALPDQMAQAGFYHQPSVSGEDRAMCFTCSVCLVCWEKTDEPWSEHERHSPSCPFVKGEYTQNVPLSVTYATNPAISTDGFNILSNSENCNVLCTSDQYGEITIWSIERQLKKMHSFKLKDQFKEYFPESTELEVTAICTLPDRSNDILRESRKLKSISLKNGILGAQIVIGFLAKSKRSQCYMGVFDIIDVEEETVSSEHDTNDSKSDIADKPIEQKTVNINKGLIDQNLSNDMLQICPWKFNDSNKTDSYGTNFPSLDDDITKIESELKQNTEKLLQTLTQIKSNQTRATSNEKSEEVSCAPTCMIPLHSEGEDLIISEIIPTNAGSNLLVKLSKMNKEEADKSSGGGDEKVNNIISSELLRFAIDRNGYITDIPICSRTFDSMKAPCEICILPRTENCIQKTEGNNSESTVFCIVSEDGSLELILLDNFQTIATVAPKNERFVSVTYCKSLARLCGCTENGSLIFYSLHDTDSDSGDEIIDEENVTVLSADNVGKMFESDVSEIDGASLNNGKCATNKRQQENVPGTSTSGGGGENSNTSPAFTFLAHKNELTLNDLKTLYSLTLFDEMLTPYTAEVPSCWNELVQAQKQRRHPQHLRPGDDAHYTKTWRLHNDATTWDEHIIELTLSNPASLGHIDLKFSLYQQCPSPPAIQVTILKQNTSGFGYRMKTPNITNMNDDDDTEASVDENVQFPLSGNEGVHDNPVLSEEYLQAHNAEILAGPIELSSCMDLCDQGGFATLTSPKLFKTKARNFLLHIKTMVDPSKNGQGKTRVPVRKKGVLRFLFSSFANNPSQNSTNATYSQYSTSTKQSRNDYYIGCDWLHEISITVRSTKNVRNISNERMQRIAMLESNSFLDNLIAIICKNSSIMYQSIALDILIWVCTIRLMRFRSPKLSTERMKMKDTSDSNSQKSSTATATGTTTPTPSGSTTTTGKDNQIPNVVDMLTQQKDCVFIIEKNLKEIIFNCIINGNRVTAHKAVKLILNVSEGERNISNDIQAKHTFDDSLRESIIACLPQLQSAKHASAVRWFTLLVCATSTPDSHAIISEICTKLLMNVTKEIENRWDPFCSLLGSRFGLYGFPFEPDLFDVDLPQITKSNTSSPNTLVNIIKSNAGLLQPNGMDFKKLSSIDGVEFRSFPHLIKTKSISNQLRGLLEVEPLHFTCFAASEATRIENVDSLSSSASSNINMEEIIVTPLQNNVEGQGDGKKDNDKDNMNDDVMNNVKNILVDKIFNSTLKKHKVKDDSTETKPNGFVEGFIESSTPIDSSPKYNLPKFKAICEYIYESCDESPIGENSNPDVQLSKKIQKYLNENNSDENGNSYSWHKLLTAPPKQAVVIDRIHSGARRYVVIDFGFPILLTDLVIPACDELASLFIDIWCFDEETDCVRLAVTQDIGTKTLVLSDLQPPPICRYMKITIIGRYGMSATKCKIPIGSFYGHVMILDNDAYADPLLRYMKAPQGNVLNQIKALNALYEDVHCRYSLSSSKLMEVLAPILNGELSNLSHMQAFINKQKDEDSSVNNNKIVSIYEECLSLQHQLNIIKSVIERLEASVEQNPTELPTGTLQALSRDKLRVLSESLVEIILHFTIEYGLKNIFSLHSFFTMDVANRLFNTLVVYGEAHIQLATCSLLVRMCCFQSWWGDFLANTFCTLFSSQNSKIFPQDRVFFLLTYLGRRSIAMGTCRSIVIDSILKTVAKLVAPISPRYNSGENSSEINKNETTSLWSKSDLQLITWLLLFLSVCLDENTEKKDKSANRWEFMSCEADFTKSRSQTNNSTSKNFRSFKKRIIQQQKYTNFQQIPDWGKKIYMIQNELPEIFMELTGKPKPKISKMNVPQKVPKETVPETENYFDRGLKSIRLTNIIIVIRGLIALILEMDFTCNMDLFLLTCKVIARLVSACRPSIQLSKVVTTNQLEQLIRLAVWNDQQQPWAVHAVTCLVQDLLDADKNFKEAFENENECNEINTIESVIDTDEIMMEAPSNSEANHSHNSQVVKDISYADTVKYGQLPSVMECEDAEIDIDEFLSEIDFVDRGKNLIKKDNLSQNKNSFNFFCKSISSTLDARLDCGLDTNVEISIRRLTMISSLDMYASLPQIPTTELINTTAELPAWPEYITNIWSGPEYNAGLHTYQMFIDVFDNIFADLHIQDTWVHLEQVLQMWLTLNSELSDKPYSLGLSPSDVPKIPFRPTAVQGLLLALAWHNDIKIRTWCLGFQCLILACNSQSNLERTDDSNNLKIGDIIIQDENFEKMLLRFFSGYGMSSPTSMKRCAGPTICKYLHELLLWLQMKAEWSNPTSNIKRKLKDTLLNVILQLVQPGGVICNQQGPMDAQSQLVRDLISMQYDKADLTVAMHIIESVSFLVYNHISNAEKIQCQRTCDTNNSNNAFGSLFATVLGADNNKQNTHVSDNSLIISLLKLSVSLVQTELQEKPEELIVIDLDVNNESQTDEIKAEQLNFDNKVKVPCVADNVLRHFPTMKRLLGSLSNSSSSSFTLLTSSLFIGHTIIKPDHKCSLNEPQTTTDAVFHLLTVLSEKASQPKLAVQPIYQYLEANSSPRNVLPRLQLSEPFLLYVLKILETTSAVSVFAEMGGIKILCQNLIKCNKLLINMQPGLISLIMQHMTKNSKMKFSTSSTTSINSSKKTSTQNKIQEGLINFAPFCTISAENNTAQPAEVLIQTPIASHRRARTPAWSYMFYPNESHVDLTITLPTAVLLKEIQLQPHLPTLASCPAAVALEISRDNGIGSIPFGQPLTTVGMTCIRLKLIKPEIATAVVLRLYRPKDSSSIGLTQISVLGTTIFNNSNRSMNGNSDMHFVEDDSLAKTSVGWIRLLARCFSVATFNKGSNLSKLVISSAAEYSGFLEACCNLMNVIPLIPNAAMHNLETVLLNLGNYSKTLSLTLIRTLLWNTTPQTYRVTNEAVCDLLYDLCIKQDSFALDKVSLLLDWVLKLQQNFSNRTMRCTNPQSGFVKCIASILWTLYTENTLLNLADVITNEVFEACLYWIDVLEDKEPLKLAFDSLLCSFCYIKPEFFKKLLIKVGFVLPNPSSNPANNIDKGRESSGITDDNKEISGSEWYNSVAAQNLQMLLKPSYLSTIAMACQSSLAIYQLVDSGLPKLLAHALFEYCCSMSPEIRKMISNNDKISVSNCLTDSDKAAENCERCDVNRDLVIDVDQVPEILDFFSECCSEGHMRDWLGSYQGTIFWKPLLELLCNYRPDFDSSEPLQQSFIRIERSTVNFLNRVSSCHPKNQETLTHILISVIRKPQQSSGSAGANGSKSIISGFTRRIVLQLLLENERILVSVRSNMPLQRKDHSMQLVNNHPSKRTNSYHLLFYLSTHTKCHDILQSCASGYVSNIIPPLSENPQLNDPTTTVNQKNNQHNDNRREILEGFGLSGYGMEFLSVAAGVTAKDKRLKDVRNQAAVLKDKEIFPRFTRLLNTEDFNNSPNTNMVNCVQLIHPDCPDVILSGDTTLSQILAVLHNRGYSLSAPCITLRLVPSKNSNDDLNDESQTKAANVEPLASPLQRFSSHGGLSLLAHYLPVVYPDGTKPFMMPCEKDRLPQVTQVTDWVKVDHDDIYEDIEDAISETTSRNPSITSVPQHSLAAFGLFLRLPAYSDILLRDKLKAQCLLRLVLGVTGDGEGNDIYSLSLAPSLPTLPFEVFRQLLDNSPLTTDDGVLLRRMVIDVGAMHLILNCLGIFTHQSQNYQITGPQTDVTSGVKSLHTVDEQVVSDDKSHIYWAKGTGFGTGSTQQSWDVEQALLRQKSEEEHVTVLLQVLSSYVNPGDKIPSQFNSDDIMNYHEISDVSGELPAVFLELLQQSCLIPALSSYLRNDSVLDITRHIPLYRSILQLLRAVSLSSQLVCILQPRDRTESHMSIAVLLLNMKTCVDTYAKRLKVNKKSNIKGQTQKVTVNLDDGDDEGLALLIPDIQETSHLVQKSTNADMQANLGGQEHNLGMDIDRPLSSSIEQRYLEVMKELQFDTYEMIVESENGFRFAVSHHFENNIRMAGDRGHPSRVKRLAQEAVTLSTSLPLSYSSSVFVRCDADRLDIMKVLITGPADTPYANGCFEFDVYFPSDYPNSPMLINLETTGRHSVRFNPNLYNDGKVCLSVLNTWHGRPEEKWNAQTSSFLQVLVSIQSLILVPEPYFNEPGFERSRGTPSGTHCSREYNSNIYQACVRWAMLEQIRNPNPCFKEVIHTHFWLKRHEICAQIENWIEELSKPQYSERSGRTISFNSMVLRRQYRQLREELAKLPIPKGLEDLDRPFNPNVTSLSAMTEASSSTTALSKQNSPLSQTSDSPESPPPPPPPAAFNSTTIITGESTEAATTTTTTTATAAAAATTTTTVQETEQINQSQDNSNDDTVVSVVSMWESEMD